MKGKRAAGDIGERLAIRLLKRNGYKIIERNFRCRLGEIDIIGIDKDTLVFVEVKTRWSKKFGLPQESVNQKKIETIKKVAEYYKMINRNLPEKKRIDVVAIELQGKKISSAKIIKVV